MIGAGAVSADDLPGFFERVEPREQPLRSGVEVFDTPQAFSNFMALYFENMMDGHAADGTPMKHGLCMMAMATAVVWGCSRKPESVPLAQPSVIAALASLSRAIDNYPARTACQAGCVGGGSCEDYSGGVLRVHRCNRNLDCPANMLCNCEEWGADAKECTPQVLDTLAGSLADLCLPRLRRGDGGVCC